MRFPVLILALLLAAAAVPAQAETVADIEAAWRGWMVKSGRTTGGLAVTHGGRLVHQAVMGGEAVGNAVPLASLSKAVTGVCVAGLIDRGKLAFDTPLSQALARTFARLGAPADPRMPGITIGQLLVHRAGFDRSDGDPVTGRLATYLRTATATRPSFDEQMKWLLRGRLPLAPGERYAYTNATYLMLGAVIEEVSGQGYESYCRNTVLTPLGVRGAALDPEWRILASYGGWRMPLGDYGRFYQAFAANNQAKNPVIGPSARRWMMSPDGKQMGGGVHYGLGTMVRPTPGGGNFWHWGGWVFTLDNAFDGHLNTSYATFAVRLSALDVNMVVYMTPYRGDADATRNELDNALGAAARKVTRWP
ncbi:MAG: serine hydrolase domain-containing protein [Reyranella sp.]|nr:serine hydrolase domain-containing protein [Reyranella sp.]MDP3162305.1 serine hydrolase domain-containing protein [Reyranella sp.]